jgi:hypothetical protein
LKKKSCPNFQRITELFTQKIFNKLSKISIWDPGSGKRVLIFMFLSTGCSLFRAEGFSCSLGVLYGGLGISKLPFLIKKIEIKFPGINFLQF